VVKLVIVAMVFWRGWAVGGRTDALLRRVGGRLLRRVRRCAAQAPDGKERASHGGRGGGTGREDKMRELAVRVEVLRPASGAELVLGAFRQGGGLALRGPALRCLGSPFPWRLGRAEGCLLLWVSSGVSPWVLLELVQSMGVPLVFSYFCVYSFSISFSQGLVLPLQGPIPNGPLMDGQCSPAVGK